MIASGMRLSGVTLALGLGLAAVGWTVSAGAQPAPTGKWVCTAWRLTAPTGQTPPARECAQWSTQATAVRGPIAPPPFATAPNQAPRQAVSEPRRKKHKKHRH